MPHNISTQAGARAFIQETLQQHNTVPSNNKLLFSDKTGQIKKNTPLNHIEVWSNLEGVTAEEATNDRESFINLLTTAYPEHADVIIAHVEKMGEAKVDANVATIGMLREAHGRYVHLDLREQFEQAFQGIENFDVSNAANEVFKAVDSGKLTLEEVKVLIDSSGKEDAINAVMYSAPALSREQLGATALANMQEDISKLAREQGNEDVIAQNKAVIKAYLEKCHNPSGPAPFTASPKVQRGLSPASSLVNGQEALESKPGWGAGDSFKALARAFDPEQYSAVGVSRDSVGLLGLADILISRCLYTEFSGPLTGGMDRALFAGPHGPYYIVIDNAAMKQEKEGDGEWPAHHCYTLNCIAYITVPNEEQKQFVVEALQAAFKEGFIDQEQYDEAMSKITTYDDAAVALNAAKTEEDGVTNNEDNS